jgi:hypothetical protein
MIWASCQSSCTVPGRADAGAGLYVPGRSKQAANRCCTWGGVGGEDAAPTWHGHRGWVAGPHGLVPQEKEEDGQGDWPTVWRAARRFGEAGGAARQPPSGPRGICLAYFWLVIVLIYGSLSILNLIETLIDWLMCLWICLILWSVIRWYICVAAMASLSFP